MRVTTNLRLWGAISVIFASVLSGSVWAVGTYNGGDGSQGNPFQINTPAQMDEIGQHSEDWGSYFVLTADIDLAGFTGTQFNIIGEWIDWEDPGNIPFSGVFDGDGHTISNFTDTSTGTDNIGLFRYVGSGGEIKDLGMTNVNVNGGTGYYVGGLVGRNSGTVSNCYSTGTGTVTGGSLVGGLVGYNYYGTISNCYATGFLTGDNYVGGLVGGNYDADIFASFWDTQTTGQATNGVGSIRGSGTVEVYGRTTAEMKTQSTFTDYGWDFVGETANGTEDIWVMFGDGLDYPRLTWELDPSYPGSGTEGDPYLISTPEQMNEIGQHSEDWGSYFILTADIDLFGYTGTAFTFNIIGNGSTKFTGVFDGNGRTISNFTYSSTSTNYIALFGYVGTGGEIKDLGLTNVNVDAGTGWCVGGLVGRNYGTVSNCYATGAVTGDHYVGGLVGGDWGGTVSNCYATAYVSGYAWVGGLVGLNNACTVSNCYATGNVTGYTYVGGLVGWNYYGRVSNCYAAGSVSGDYNVGGLVGKNEGGTVSNCYATGTVTATYDYVGGLVGYNTGTVSKCYATGALTATYDYVGGLVGYNTGTVSNCYATGTVTPTYDYVGGLVGYNTGTVSNSYATGSVSGDYYVAGLVGYNSYGTVSNCYATGNVTATHKYVGGLVGSNSGTVSNCYSTGSVTGGYHSDCVGGLVGWSSGTVKNCCASGSVTGYEDVGGMVGWNEGTLSNCYAYASGNITGYWDVGGLVGLNSNDGSISDCYSAGIVSGYEDVGGLVGRNYYADILASFWDTERTGQANGVGYNEGDGTVEVYGRTTAQMQTESTFTDYGWDFVSETANGTDDIWRLCEDGSYPKLSWEFSIGDFVCRDGVDLADFAYFSRDWLLDACARTDLNGDCLVDIDDLVIFADHWLFGAGMVMDIELILDNFWMYQNLPTATDCNLTANVSIIDDQSDNTSYTYEWEFVLPDDVTIAPTIIDGGTATDPFCTFAAPSCDEPNGLSDSGQPFTVKVTVTGDDYGNTGQAQAQFGIALLGDVNNDTAVNVADRSIINAFWQTGSAEDFTLRDCDLNCDGAVNVADRSIANAIWRGVLGQNSVDSPCPFR